MKVMLVKNICITIVTVRGKMSTLNRSKGHLRQPWRCLNDHNSVAFRKRFVRLVVMAAKLSGSRIPLDRIPNRLQEKTAPEIRIRVTVRKQRKSYMLELLVP